MIRRLFYLAIWPALVLPMNVLAQIPAGTGGTAGSNDGTGGTAGGGDVVLTNPLAVNSISAIVDKIVNFLLVLAGPIAVLMLVYAGYLFIVGGTKEENIKKARSIILYVVIGIAVLVLSKAIVYVTCNALGVTC